MIGEPDNHRVASQLNRRLDSPLEAHGLTSLPFVVDDAVQRLSRIGDIVMIDRLGDRFP